MRALVTLNRSGMDPQTPVPTDAPSPPHKRAALVAIVLLLVAVAAVGVVLLVQGDDDGTSSDTTSTTATTTPAGQAEAKALFAAWQHGNRAAARAVATPAATAQLFAIPARQGRGLVFGGCSTINARGRRCIWSRPGGMLTIVTVLQADGAPKVVAADLTPAGLPPTSTG